MSLLDRLKNIPLDLGQGRLRAVTEGKRIAHSLVGPGTGRTALDVGCREGIQSERLKARGYAVTSIDVEKQYAAARIVDVNQPLPFRDASFDLIWCSEVLEHLTNPEAAAREFMRVLKTNGELILTTPNSYALIFRLLYCFGLTPQRLQRKDHLHFFRLRDLRKLFPDARILGYFPYMLLKFRIERGVGLLSPTFVVHCNKSTD